LPEHASPRYTRPREANQLGRIRKTGNRSDATVAQRTIYPSASLGIDCYSLSDLNLRMQSEAHTKFQISLEHVESTATHHRFRVAFFGSESRILLPYPQITGLQFLNDDDSLAAAIGSQFLVSSPLDDFVLTPDSRIAFDLWAYVNLPSGTHRRWTIALPAGRLRARFRYHVDDKREWYDFLAKRSRFADVTPPWNGTIESDTIDFANDMPENFG
jgi:hypothetical protein